MSAKADKDAPDPAEPLVPLRVGIQTFGCRSNYADTVELQAGLVASGALPCSSEAAADVYVVNTCTVTDTADREALKTIRKLKRAAPDARIVVTGCMAEAKAAELEALAEVDAVCGPGRKAALLSAILTGQGTETSFDAEEQQGDTELKKTSNRIERRRKRSLPDRYSISLKDEFPDAIAGPASLLGESQLRSRYHLRIQEGCENSCTFCIIPSTRGLLSSRPVDLILRDLQQLSARGFREVVLTGTHIGGYGEDVGGTFLDLLRKIASEAENYCYANLRIRISSIDPNDLPLELVELIAAEPIFCEHLHICFQAFSDGILKKMNRRYSLAEAISQVRYARKIAPQVSIGTDIITGFPGESEEIFQESIRVFNDLALSYLHVFPYSEREGTAAVHLADSVSRKERKRRAARWRVEAERAVRRDAEKRIGNELEVVAERITAKEIRGTSREFQSCVWRSSEMAVKPGEVVRVRAEHYDDSRGLLQCRLSPEQ